MIFAFHLLLFHTFCVFWFVTDDNYILYFIHFVLFVFFSPFEINTFRCISSNRFHSLKFRLSWLIPASPLYMATPCPLRSAYNLKMAFTSLRRNEARFLSQSFPLVSSEPRGRGVAEVVHTPRPSSIRRGNTHTMQRQMNEKKWWFASDIGWEITCSSSFLFWIWVNWIKTEFFFFTILRNFKKVLNWKHLENAVWIRDGTIDELCQVVEPYLVRLPNAKWNYSKAMPNMGWVCNRQECGVQDSRVSCRISASPTLLNTSSTTISIYFPTKNEEKTRKMKCTKNHRIFHTLSAYFPMNFGYAPSSFHSDN